MQRHRDVSGITGHPEAWNRTKLVGPKPPLQPKHVWAIRTRLQLDRRIRDLALFNLAIDSKLRGCDVVSLMVDDVAPHGCALERATVRQRKTGRPVKFEITEQTRHAIDEYLRGCRKRRGEFLFTGRRGDRSLTTRQYARLVSQWIASVGLDPSLFGTHSLRRTKADPDLQANREPAGGPACCWGIRRSRAPSGISASRSMMLSPSPSRSTSDPEGRAAMLCPLRLRARLTSNSHPASSSPN